MQKLSLKKIQKYHKSTVFCIQPAYMISYCWVTLVCFYLSYIQHGGTVSIEQNNNLHINTCQIQNTSSLTSSCYFCLRVCNSILCLVHVCASSFVVTDWTGWLGLRTFNMLTNYRLRGLIYIPKLLRNIVKFRRYVNEKMSVFSVHVYS